MIRANIYFKYQYMILCCRLRILNIRDKANNIQFYRGRCFLVFYQSI